jgi:hypothetical protein
MSKKLYQRTTLIFQAEISAGMTKNQPAVPSNQGPKTTLNSAPAAKTDKSEVEKKETEPPEVSEPATVKSEKPTDALPYMRNKVDGLEEDNPVIKDLKAVTTKLKKGQEEEFNKSTMLTRLVVLDTKSSPMETFTQPAV